MYQIKTMNKISEKGLERLPAEHYTIGDNVENEDGILVRSAKLHDYVFPDSLRAIARAGAGTNNIPIDRCSEAGIVVSAIRHADVLIIGGTSLTVYPAAGLVRYYRGDKLAVINKTALGTGADLTITEPIGAVMAQL